MTDKPTPAADDDCAELTPEQVAAIEAAPCSMFHQPPYDFAWCETHDTTFALGDVCRYQKQNHGEAADE